MTTFLKIVSISSLILSFSFYNNPIKPIKPNNSNTATTFQDTLDWKFLSDVKYESRKHPVYGEIDARIVGEKIKKYKNKTIIIKGFILPIDTKTYAISKSAFASCFFCGKSGPETVIELKFKKKSISRIKTDTYLTIKGKFNYNETEVDKFIYSLDQVEIIK